MYRHLFPLLCLVTSVLTAGAQSAAATPAPALTAKLEALRALVPTVVTAGRDEIDQALSYDAAAPYLLTVTRSEGSGTRVATEVARVNLALLRRVRLGDGRGTRLPVTLYADADNILVGDPEGARQGFASEFDLLAGGADNARAIVAAVEELLPLAKAAYEQAAALPSDVAGLQRFVAERVRGVEAGRESYTQALTFDESAGTGTLSASGSGVRDEPTETLFLVGDLQDRALKLDTRGGLVTLTAPVRRGREYVQVDQAGARDFDDEVVLRFADYGEAQLVSEALGKLIALTAEREKATRTAPGSMQAAASLLQAAFAKTDLPEVTQTFAGECRATVTVENRGRDISTETFEFNFADVDPRGIDVRSSRGYITVGLNTRDRGAFVKHAEDGQTEGFDNKVDIRLSSALAVRDAVTAVEYLAANCTDAVTAPSLADAVASANVRDFGDGGDEQVLAKADNDCAYVLTLDESVGSKRRETQTTFSLRDLDPRTGSLKVQGTKVSLTYGTRRRERMIDVVQDGGSQRYEDEVSLRFPDVQAARAFQLAFAEAIKACE